MHFDIHAKVESLRDENVWKIYYIKVALLASGLKTFFLSENPNELCDRLGLLLKEKQTGKYSKTNKEEMVAISDNLLE